MMENRLPPQDVELEKSLLATILLYPQTGDDVFDILNPTDFYRTAHQEIYFVMVAMMADNLTPEIPLLVSRLRDKAMLEKVGGASYVASLTENPIVNSAAEAARSVKGKAVCRRVISAAYEVGQMAHTEPAECVLDAAQSKFLSIEFEKGEDEIYKISDLVIPAVERYEERSEHRGEVVGIPSGLRDLDYYLCGFQPGDLIILAGRPSMGKSALGGNAGVNAAKKGYPTAIFSLEMTKEQYTDRIISSESGVDLVKFRNGGFTREDWQRVVDAASVIADLPLHICDKPGINPQYMRRVVRGLAKKHGVRMAIVDYLQLMSGGVRSGSREQEISHISRAIKGMAKELNMPIIAMSQLNRQLESRTDKHPMLSDLRESGSLEQDADVVLFIYRDEVYNKDESSPLRGTADIDISKQRMGPTKRVRAFWNAKTTTFNNAI